jgi:phosphoribosylformylglycinamidine synthase
VAVGADPARIALLDNFCWGDPKRPETLGSLVAAARGCQEAALYYQTPFISGKDSLNNEYLGSDGQRHAIPPTLLISAIGLIEDVGQAVTMDLKAPGDLLYLVGAFQPRPAGVPGLPPGAPAAYRALHRAMQSGLLRACHDLSEGGLAVAAAEMCIGGRLGLELALPGDNPRLALFGETNGCLLVEVRPADAPAFESAMADWRLAGQPCQRLGTVRAEPILNIAGGGQPILFCRSLSCFPPGATPHDPKSLILHATGTNRDHEAAQAFELAGAQPEIVHLNQLRHGERRWEDYQLLALAGGFSYADALGAGRLLALDLTAYFTDEVQRFVASGKPVIGICNGFQALVKAGILPGGILPGGILPGETGQLKLHQQEHKAALRRLKADPVAASSGVQQGLPTPEATLTFNDCGHFECRWVTLRPVSQTCPWTRQLEELIYCPIAHGEGKFALANHSLLAALSAHAQVALTYSLPDGAPANGAYPHNPNGSTADIAGLCNPAGNVLGLMPHPEDHLFDYQHPRWTRGERGQKGLPLCVNGVRYAKGM